MILSIEAVDEFKKIYLKETGVDLPLEVAKELASRLIRLFKIIFSPNKFYEQRSDQNY